MSNVAIIGAGISGIACAYRLEQLGFPGEISIFEEKSGPHACNTYPELVAEVLHRPIRDYIAYMADKYGLIIRAATEIFHSKTYSPSTEAEYSGFLGHVVLRGGDEHSIENQLRSQIRTKIHYDTKVSYQEMKKNYDYVVLATGNWNYIADVVRFRIDGHVAFDYAIVKEQDKKIPANQVEQWLNTKYSGTMGGYAYKIPLCEGKAMMTCTGLIDPQVDPVRSGWDLFKKEQIEGKYHIVEEHQIQNYLLGEPETIRIGNTLLTGANAGCNNPFLGFGQLNSLLSGIYAAQTIANGDDYELNMKFIRDEYKRGLALLKRMHMLGDTGYDLLVKAAWSEPGKSFLSPAAPNILEWVGTIASWTYFADQDGIEILSTEENLNQVKHYPVRSE